MPEGKHGTALFQLKMVNAIPQEAEIQLRVLWGTWGLWLTLGTAAWSLATTWVTCWANRRGILQLWSQTYICISTNLETNCSRGGQGDGGRMQGVGELYLSAACVPRLWLSRRKLATECLVASIYLIQTYLDSRLCSSNLCMIGQVI